MNIEIFYHMFCSNYCVERFISTYNKIKNSGLLQICNNIHIVMVGKQHAYYANQLMGLEKIRPYFRVTQKQELMILLIYKNTIKI